jgi:phospholipase C
VDPPHNVAFGERLIARCYDALRNGAGWEQTLFIVTYDEHGGLYDHVAPPAAVPPDDAAPDGFRFDRYGVRVPAVIVSPWMPAGTIVRPPEGAQYPFDHASIIATLRKLFDLGLPLTKRDEAAPHLLDSLSLATPTNTGPTSLELPTISPSMAELTAAHAAPANSLQRSLAELSDHLPVGNANVVQHTDRLAKGATPLAQGGSPSVADALSRAQSGLDRFLSSPRSTG